MYVEIENVEKQFRGRVSSAPVEETKKTSLEMFTVNVDHVGPCMALCAIVRLFRVNSAN